MNSSLHKRLEDAVGRLTYKDLADLTQTNAESVRRYMTGQTPSVEFLSGICRSAGVSGHWLLTGRGPMRESEMLREALKQAETSDLVVAMGDMLQRLVERVEGLEVYVQELDARVRAHGAQGGNATGEPHELRSASSQIQPHPTPERSAGFPAGRGTVSRHAPAK